MNHSAEVSTKSYQKAERPFGRATRTTVGTNGLKTESTFWLHRRLSGFMLEKSGLMSEQKRRLAIGIVDSIARTYKGKKSIDRALVIQHEELEGFYERWKGLKDLGTHI